jgi:succinyl-diaminopimelate desuccinylase
VLDLTLDVGALCAALVDIESVSRGEARIADEIEAGLRAVAGGQARSLAVERDGNVVLARTQLGRSQRVVLAGHIDTVPVADNLPARWDGDRLYGCGTSDMKSGVAVLLRIAAMVGVGEIDPRVDLTFVCYDCEEIEADHNGIGRLARERPEVLQGDLAILLEPTDGVVEGGCQGTLRAAVHIDGVRAHSARSWLGLNAIHAAAPLLARLRDYQAREVDVDGLRYHEGLNAVAITGGVAGNVVPDTCTVTVNFRFAPDRSEEQALAHVREVFTGYAVELLDSAPGARPGLDRPLPQAVVAATGGSARAKLGWTDVARFGLLGIPAINLGPGDPNLAHAADEHVQVSRIVAAEAGLARFLA